MTDLAPPRLRIIGDNPTLLWGLTSAERARRLARALRLDDAQVEDAGPLLLVGSRHVFDRKWLQFMVERPGTVLTFGGAAVLAHVGRPDPTLDAALAEAAPPPAGRTAIRVEDHRDFYDHELRKRETPVFEALTPATVRGLERQTYLGAYKGVTDLLTKYLWPEWALVLTRIAARLGITPNQVTAIGAILCVWATILFWHGHYWSGMALGLVFMVLDTVDGKLARCTITASKLGEAFDHGIDLVHPPFWWWAWGHGLAAHGLALTDVGFAAAMIAIVGGYVVQRLIEGEFIRRFRGMHIHVWQRFDTDFRLITARRNPNMVLLLAATAIGRPDLGLIAVAWWTVISCLVHLVRLVQAIALRRRGLAVASWLEA